MPSARTTVLLAVLTLAGFGYLFLFETHTESTEARQASQGRIVRFAPDEVRQIRIRRDAWTSALIERVDAHAFRLVEPVEGAADEPALMRLLSQLEFLRSGGDLPDGADEGRRFAYGLSPPRLEIDLEIADGRQLHLSLGSAPPVGGGVYLAVAGEDSVHVVDQLFFSNASELLDRSVGAGKSDTDEKEP